MGTDHDDDGVPPSAGPMTVVCVYRFKPGVTDAAIRDLLRRHRAALVAGAMTTARAPYVMRSTSNDRVYVEVFDWRTQDDSRRAHHDPGVQAVWRAFGELCETCGLPFGALPEKDRPFCHFEAVTIAYDREPAAKARRAAPAKRKASAARFASKKPAAKASTKPKAASKAARKKPARRGAARR